MSIIAQFEYFQVSNQTQYARVLVAKVDLGNVNFSLASLRQVDLIHEGLLFLFIETVLGTTTISLKPQFIPILVCHSFSAQTFAGYNPLSDHMCRIWSVGKWTLCQMNF